MAPGIRANRAMAQLLGYTPEELIGVHYTVLTYADDVHLDQKALDQLLASGGRGQSVEKRFLHRDGHSVWTRVTPNLVHGPDGSPLGAVVVVEDVAEHRHRYAELSRLALTDPLTGMRNRALLDEEIDAALRERDRDGGVIALC